MKQIELFSEEIDILVGLIQYEIRHLAALRGEFVEKDLGCGNINNRISRLQRILKDLTNA